jgi:mono/diheme cytochrome c family protein
MRLLVCLTLLILPQGGTAGSLDKGERLFALHCAACHGSDARGGGTLGGSLEADPADLTRLATRNGGVFPRVDAVRKIDGRSPIAGHGGEMPVYGWFFDGPETQMPAQSGETIITTEAISRIILWLESVQE